MHSFYRQHPASHLHGYTNPHMGPAQFNFTLLRLAVDLFHWSKCRLSLWQRTNSCYTIYLMIFSVIYIISYRVLVLLSGAVCIQSFHRFHFIGFSVKVLTILHAPRASWCIVQCLADLLVAGLLFKLLILLYFCLFAYCSPQIIKPCFSQTVYVELVQFVSELNQGPCIWQYICHQHLVVLGSIVHLHPLGIPQCLFCLDCLRPPIFSTHRQHCLYITLSQS